MRYVTRVATTCAVVILLSGCGGGPYRVTQPGPDEAYLRFSGARAGQSVYVDGVLRGSTEQFNGAPGVLATGPGLRSIEIRQGDQVILRDQVFIGSGVTKTLSIP